jgi:hypothetical protein
VRAATAGLALIVVAGFVARPVNAELLHIVLASPLVEEGSGPDGCTPALSGLGGPAVWQVRVERYLLDGKALIEASRIAEPNRFPLCIADRVAAKNAEVELPFVAHEGGSARVAGVVLRFADPQDFYVVEADALAGRVRFLSIINGERREIAGRDARLVVGKAETLGVKVIDNRFEITLDGKPLFEATDAGLTTAGRLGIWSRADSDTSFGDLFITVLD